MEKIKYRIKQPLLIAIRCYQYFISPLLGNHCRFFPSCSHYAYEALCRHGLAKGLYLGLIRLSRCNPLCGGGYDPVPIPSKQFIHKQLEK